MSKFILCLICLGIASAEDLVIQFASPVAAQSYQFKKSAFVFRTLGCPSDVKPEVSATAEGLVDGQRQSVSLKVTAVQASAGNVFAIFREWSNQGVWIVSVKAHCGGKSAGVLVATDAQGIVRESSTVLNHPATEKEIENSLRSGKKPRGPAD